MAASRSFQIRSYFSYWLNAVDEHSLHSPFFFDFYSTLLKKRTAPEQKIETLRRKLLHDHRQIRVNDLGSSSRKNYPRKISDIASTSLSDAKFSGLYRRIVSKYKHSTIIELGTSLGINTLYLANPTGTKVITLEGSEEIANVAEISFSFAEAKNISLFRGDIQITLPMILQTVRKIDFAFIDANHTYEATMRYFNLLVARLHEKSVLVIDDIHYSAEMEKAWNEITRSKLVYGSADLYRAGFLFFDPSLNKQHVILQY